MSELRGLVAPRAPNPSRTGLWLVFDLFCREAWVTLMSRNIGDSQDRSRRGWRGPPGRWPEGW
jgi:hypothetical protein